MKLIQLTTFQTNRELRLAVTTIFLSGLVLGMFLSPRKNVRIGCDNGNNSGNEYGKEKEDE